MANPQKEDGYTAVANEILEHVYSQPMFGGVKLKILMLVWRYTYGYGRTEHELSLSFIANSIGSTPKVVSRELQKLLNMSVLIRSARGCNNHSQVLRFNKNYDEWDFSVYQIGDTQTVDSLPNRGHLNGGEVSPKWGSCYPPNGRTAIPQMGDHIKKNINKNLKKNIISGAIHTTINNIISAAAPELTTAVKLWIEHSELEEKSATAFLEIVSMKRNVYNDRDIAEVITECISENRRMIFWDRLEKKKAKSEQTELKHDSAPDELEQLTWERIGGGANDS
ncbi:MAG: replication protein [Clostridia bacterium]|nr:replication protein [Clostridia bacterium]